MDQVVLPTNVRVDPENVVAKAFAVSTVTKADGVAGAIYEVDPDGFSCYWMSPASDGEEAGIETDSVYLVNYKGQKRWTWTVDPATWSVRYVG